MKKTFFILLVLLFSSLLKAETATWNFATNEDIQEVIGDNGQSGKTLTLSSDVEDINMYVDASSGVFELNHDEGQTGSPINSVHINSGTKMYVPVKKVGDVITITTTLAESAGDNPSGAAYHPNTITISGTTTTYTAQTSDVQAEWLCIVATTDTYVESVKVEYEETTTPLLLGFTFNGEEYTASDVFTYNEDTQVFSGSIEITKDSDYAPSASNLPVVVGVEDGAVDDANVTFTEAVDGEDYGTVTIIVTDGETEPTTTTTYILSFKGKPDYTVSYYYDDAVVKTQEIEQDATIGEFATAVEVEGLVFRGWYYENGRKATVDDVITADVALYALINEAEVATGDSSWDYDLTDQYFYPEDHELIDLTGEYSNATHGWSVQSLTVEVSSDAFIILGMCSRTTGKVTITIDDVVVEEFEASFEDGETYTYHYQASEGGKVTFTFAGSGYLHFVHLRNIAGLDIEEAEENGEDFYWVDPSADDVQRVDLLMEILEIVNSLTNDGSRVVIFLPDGVYDLGSECLPTINRSNVSIVGQSMENTIIKNSINFSTSKENALLLNNSTGLYLQDLTLENDYPYYEKSSDRRGVCLQDKGSETICKNVRMLSYQNTYYTSNDNQHYLETSDLHGTLDFILGSGDVYFNGCTLYVEGRKEAGVGSTSEAIITSPNTSETCLYGYVFNGCTVTGVSGQTYSYGRAWSNNARCVWIDTELDESLTLTNNRWYLAGTSANIVPCLFAEYGTTPASTRETATFNGTLKTIALTEDAEADEYTVDYYDYENIFETWDPQSEAQQVELSELKCEVGSSEISWTGSTDAVTYAVFLNGLFEGFTEATSYTLSRALTEEDIVELRAGNTNGGLGKAVTNIEEETAKICTVTTDAELISVEYYDLSGRRLSAPQRGMNIKVLRYSDGSLKVEKINH